MATAYIPGQSLADVITRQGPLGEAEVRELGTSLAEGLGAIHACGLIHRDLKPGNVIMADDGPRIIDFGIAKGADATALTPFNAVVGTFRYMAPEQLQGKEVTARSDVFSLGAVLAYAATGHDAFEAQTMPAVITRILIDPPNLDPLTGELRDIIAECLAKEPSARPAAADLLTRLAPAPVPVPVQPVHVSEPEPVRGPTTSTPAPADSGEMPPGSPTETVGLAQVTASPGDPVVRADQPGRRGRRAIAAAVTAAAAAAVVVPVVLLVGLPGPPAHTDTPSPAAPTRTRPGKPQAPTFTDSFSAATGSLTPRLTGPGKVHTPYRMAAFGPDGDVVAANDLARATYVWDSATGRRLGVLKDPGTTGLGAVAANPGGGVLATGDNNGTTYLWSPVTMQRMTTTLVSPTGGSIWALSVGADGMLAAGTSNGYTDLWNTKTGQHLKTLPKAPGPILTVALDNGLLAVGVKITDKVGLTYLWSYTAKSVRLVATLREPQESSVKSVAWTPNGLLATADGNGDIYLWNPHTHRVTEKLTDPDRAQINQIAFGLDGVLAAGDINGNTYLWNFTTHRTIGTLTGPGHAQIYAVTFGPAKSGSTDALGVLSADGHMYLWQLKYR
jgi:WD40 repeat protein